MRALFRCTAWAPSLLLWMLLLWSAPQFRNRNRSRVAFCQAARAGAPLVVTPFDPSLEVTEYVLSTEARDQLTIFPRHQVPQIRRIEQPDALLLAVNIKEVALLPGDRVVIRDARNATAVTITARNQSIAKHALRRPKPVLWNHPFVVAGSRVTIEYWPSLLTLTLPINRKQLDNAVLVVDSYTFAYLPGRGGSSPPDDTSDTDDTGEGELESTVGLKNEMKPAVCYKKFNPDWYNKARSVARLIISKDSAATLAANRPRVQPYSYSGKLDSKERPSDQPVYTFCTGWLMGRGNHMLSNYHCFYEMTRPMRGELPNAQAASRLRSQGQPGDEPVKRCSTEGSRGDGSSFVPRVTYSTQASVNFLAESTSCNTTGPKTGQPMGEIDATEVEILASSEDLDYVLLRLHPSRNVSNTNSSADEVYEDQEIDLARTFGYMTVRESGPEDGEPIYIPQHPNGELKTIASMKNGKPATIHVGNSSRIRGGGDPSTSDFDNVSVWYNADTAPGSSGSPVLSQEDDTVVALHHAGTGPRVATHKYGWISRWVNRFRGSVREQQYNIGIRIDAIVADMREKDVLPPCAVAEKCEHTNGKQSGDKKKNKSRSVCCDKTW